MVFPVVAFVIFPAPAEFNVGARQFGLHEAHAMFPHKMDQFVFGNAPVLARGFGGLDEAFFCPVDYGEPTDMAIFRDVRGGKIVFHGAWALL